MEEENNGGALNSNMNGLLKIAIFSMVAVIIVATVAVPILANVGSYTKSEYNDGARIDFADADYFSGIIDEFSSAENVRMILNQDGFGLTGLIDAQPYTKIVLPVSKYDTRYPIVINGVGDSQYGMIYYYDTTTQKYTVTSILGSSEVEWTYVDPIAYPTDLPVWAQTSNGTKVITSEPLKFKTEEDRMGSFGLTMQEGKILIADTYSHAYLATKDGSDPTVTTIGEPTVSITDGTDWDTINSISFSGSTCQYLIGVPSVSSSGNYIDGTQIGTLISIIPILIIAGIIVAIIKGKSMSDR